MKNFKVTISGAHSQGKTTLLNRLSRDNFLAEKNFQFGASTSRDLKKIGINIAELGSDVTQVMVMSKHIENAFKEGNWLLDRCMLDSLAYAYATNARGGIQYHTYSTNKTIFNEIRKKYDLMFYIKPELKLVDDGIRSLDIGYFQLVVDGFEKLISEDAKIVVLSGSVEQRYNTAIEHIKKLF